MWRFFDDFLSMIKKEPFDELSDEELLVPELYQQFATYLIEDAENCSGDFLSGNSIDTFEIKIVF